MARNTITSDEVMSLLGIDTTSLRKLRKQKKIPFIKSNKKYFYKAADIMKYKRVLALEAKSIHSYPAAEVLKWPVHPAGYVRKILREARITLSPQ